MSVEDWAPKTPTPEAAHDKPAQEKPGGDSAENRQESAREVLLNFLAGKNVIAGHEVALVSPEKVDELIVRTAHDYEHIPQEIPQARIEKTRRILGLGPNPGEGRIDTSERGGEIKRLVEEMRSYLEKYRAQCPEVLGMVLCGSRMDPDKLPAPDSDVDTVLILKDGTMTDPRTKEGEALLYRLRAFSDSTPTDSGLPVELDELYPKDSLFSKLQDPTDKSKLTWGWNPNAVRYIGDDLGDLDEMGVQIEILKGLSHADMIEFKKEMVAKAKESILRSLGQK